MSTTPTRWPLFAGASASRTAVVDFLAPPLLLPIATRRAIGSPFRSWVKRGDTEVQAQVHPHALQQALRDGLPRGYPLEIPPAEIAKSSQAI